MRALLFYITQIVYAILSLLLIIAAYPISLLVLFITYVITILPILVICGFISYVVLSILHAI